MAASENFDPKYITKAEIRSKGRAVRPKDAATLIIVRRDAKQAKILMGKRAAGHKFMPNKFVFPGGKVDPGDGRIRPPNDFHPDVLKRLVKGCSESRARALGLAAIRETFEETGGNLTLKWLPMVILLFKLFFEAIHFALEGS